MSATQADIAAQLIERLLADPAFRARFRRNPAEACREAGLDELADEMSLASGGAMHTLDLRESRSSLAGVMMAAAMEGIGVYEFTKHIAPAFEGVPEAVNDVLSRVHLPTIPGRGALAGASPPPAPPVEPTDGAAGADAAASAGGGGGGAAAAAAEAPAPPAQTPEEAVAAGKAADGKAAEAAQQDPAAKAAAKIAEKDSPEAKQQAKIDEGLADAKDEAADLPTPTDLPSGPVPLHEAEAAPGGAQDAPAPAAPPQAPAPAAPAPEPPAAPAAARPAGPPRAARPPAAPPQAPAPAAPAPEPPAAPAAAAAPEVAAAAPSSGSGAIDPAQFGAEGTGGPPSPETVALLDNKNVV